MINDLGVFIGRNFIGERIASIMPDIPSDRYHTSGKRKAGDSGDP